jgi:hypothetical protein
MKKKYNFPKGKSLERQIEFREPKLKLVVVCEGKNTEPDYLEKFKQEHGNQLVSLVLVKGAGVP